MIELTKDRFLACVQQHQMTVLLDNGIYRHLRFKAHDTGNQYFEIMTFPGRLVYCGDMGSYLFERTQDMFAFFRRANGGINLNYWAEKVEARDRDGVTEFSLDKTKESIRDVVESQADELEEEEQASIKEELETLLGELDEDVGDFNGVLRVLRDYDGEFIDSNWFTDFWEHAHEEYTYRFQWACYAIAWGIEQYDNANLQSEVVQ